MTSNRDLARVKSVRGRGTARPEGLRNERQTMKNNNAIHEKPVGTATEPLFIPEHPADSLRATKDIRENRFIIFDGEDAEPFATDAWISATGVIDLREIR